MLMKFVLTQPLDEAAMKVLKEAGADVYIANSPDLPSYIDKIQEADALVIRVGQCTAEVIDACPNLKVIGITGVGYDRVDVCTCLRQKAPGGLHSRCKQSLRCRTHRRTDVCSGEKSFRI